MRPATTPPDPDFEIAEGSAPPPEVVRAAGRIRQSIPPSASDEDFEKALEVFGDYVLKKSGGGGGGGDGGDPIAGKSDRRKLVGLIALIGLLFGAGGPVAAYYALKSQVGINHDMIEQHAREPMHREAVERVDKIEGDLLNIKIELRGDDGTGGIKGRQSKILDGIDQLKREAQTEKQRRLEQENERLRERLRNRR